MLEQMKYINHVNEEFSFGSSGIYVNTNNLHDYEWKVTSKGNRISSLTRQVSTRKLPVIILCDSEEQGIQARNMLLEVAEKDVLAMEHGKIVIGNYYFKCFVTKSSKANYLTNKRYMLLDLTLTSDYPYWVQESTTSFRTGTQSVQGSGVGLDFPYDYPFDFFSTMASTTLSNPGFVPTNFKMVIYGACSNPSISIAGHTYQVNCEIGESEYLTIDSSTKKIQLVKNDGTIVNKFNDRNKQSYIFEKSQQGIQMLHGLAIMDLTLFCWKKGLNLNGSNLYEFRNG